MKHSPATEPPEFSSWLEALEDRIAPAALDPGSFISTPVGTPILLKAGQGLATSSSGGDYLLYVEKGQALVFTTDLNANNQVDANEITGIAAGDGLRLLSFVDIHGDIVTNLNANGTLTDSTPDGIPDGKVLLNSKIEAITLRPLTDADLKTNIPGETVENRKAFSTYSIYGNIYAGGGFGVVGGGLTIDTTTGSETVVPSIGSIIVGTAASGQFFNFGVTADDTGTLSGFYGYLAQFKPGSGVAGADIIGIKAGKTVTTTETVTGTDIFGHPTSTTKTVNTFSSVDFTLGSLIAGDGGFGARGGNIQNVSLKGDVGALHIIAGNGGDGENGGAGGSILNLSNAGSHQGFISLQTGNGGNGIIGKGGNGGTLNLGEFKATSGYEIILGAGGDGLTGGGTGASFSGKLSSAPTEELRGLAVVSSKHVTGTIGKQDFIDFDGDGYNDIVFLSTNPDQLVVAFGGWGDFGSRRIVLDTPVFEPLTTTTAGLTVTDVNGDGYDDIIIATNSTRTSASLITYVWNPDLNDFNLGIYSALPFATQAIIGLEAGDFNGDGIMDIGVLNHSGSVYLAKGVGNGLFFVDYGKSLTTNLPTKSPVTGLGPSGLEAKIVATSAQTGDVKDILVGAVLNDGARTTINAFTYSGTSWSSKGASATYRPWSANPDYPADPPDPLVKPWIRTGLFQSLTPSDFTVLDIDGDGIFDVAAVNTDQVALSLLKGNTTSGPGLSQPDKDGVILYGGTGPEYEVIQSNNPGIFTGIVAADLAALGSSFDTFGIYTNRSNDTIGFYQFKATGFSQADVKLFGLTSDEHLITTNSPVNPDGTLVDAYHVFGASEIGFSFITGAPRLASTNAGNVALVNNALFLNAGDGGDSLLGNGGAGGSIKNLTLAGIGGSLTAGWGGNGAVNGGAGGELSGINGGASLMIAGNGGTGISGKGGVGGSIFNFTVGGRLFMAGDGGSGYQGGAGGSIIGKGTVDPDNTKPGIAPLELVAGNGGDGIVSGGNGGSITNFLSIISGNNLVSYVAGDGGHAGAGWGGNGGSIVNSSPSAETNGFTGKIELQAGAGGNGLTGGNGGNITKFVNSPTGVDPAVISVLAGSGGYGVIGAGGTGGSISSVTMSAVGLNGDQKFNRFLAGNGGASFGAAGGAGGNVSSLITSANSSSTAIAAGAGGDGLLRGGAGGNLTAISANATGVSPNYKVLAIAGAGGDAYAFTAASILSGGTDFQKATQAFGGALGVGGNGGSINGFTQPGTTETRTDLIAGNGGSTLNWGSAIPGAKLAVGKGGSISNVTLAGYAGAASAADKDTAIQSYNPAGSLSDFVQDSLLDDPTTQLGALGNVGVIVGVGGNIANGLPSTSTFNGSVSNFTARGVMSMVAGSVDSIASIVSINKLTLTGGPAGSAKNAPYAHPASETWYVDVNGNYVQGAPIAGGKLMDGAIIAKQFKSSPSGPRVFTM